jgi:hypothetical protein
MCAQNNFSLSSCNGESRANKSESHPAAKHTTGTSLKRIDLRLSLSAPIAYTTAVKSSGMMM